MPINNPNINAFTLVVFIIILVILNLLNLIKKNKPELFLSEHSGLLKINRTFGKFALLKTESIIQFYKKVTSITYYYGL